MNQWILIFAILLCFQAKLSLQQRDYYWDDESPSSSENLYDRICGNLTICDCLRHHRREAISFIKRTYSEVQKRSKERFSWVKTKFRGFWSWLRGKNSPKKPTTTTNATLPDLKSLRQHINFNLINDKTCGAFTTNRETDTFEAQLIELPWVALLGYQQANGSIDWKCDGTLISKNYVLTAASCINKDLKVIRLGEHTISTQRDCDGYDCVDPVQDIAIKEKISNINYDHTLQLNDIALLKLSTPANITRNNVKTICLPVDEETVFENSKILEGIFTIFGWGHNKSKDVLERTYVPYIDQQECAQKFASYQSIKIDEKIICAGSDYEVSTCLGDSGSAITALAMTENRPKLFLYGVKSINIECNHRDDNLPGIYTNIRYYMKWILDNINEEIDADVYDY